MRGELSHEGRRWKSRDSLASVMEEFAEGMRRLELQTFFREFWVIRIEDEDKKGFVICRFFFIFFSPSFLERRANPVWESTW